MEHRERGDLVAAHGPEVPLHALDVEAGAARAVVVGHAEMDVVARRRRGRDGELAHLVGLEECPKTLHQGRAPVALAKERARLGGGGDLEIDIGRQMAAECVQIAAGPVRVRVLHDQVGIEFHGSPRKPRVIETCG